MTEVTGWEGRPPAGNAFTMRVGLGGAGTETWPQSKLQIGEWCPSAPDQRSENGVEFHVLPLLASQSPGDGRKRT